MRRYSRHATSYFSRMRSRAGYPGRALAGGSIDPHPDPAFANVAFLHALSSSSTTNLAGAGAKGIFASDGAQFNSAVQLFSQDTMYGFPTGNPRVEHLDYRHLAAIGDFSFETWVYPTSFGTVQTIGAWYVTSDGERRWRFIIETTGQLRYFFYPDGTNEGARVEVDGGTLTLNQWNYVAHSRNGNNHHVYNGLSGLPVSKGTVVTASRPDTNSSSNWMRFGERSGGSDPLVGRMGEIRVTHGVDPLAGASFYAPTAIFARS